MIELRQADFIDRNNFADFLNRTRRFGTVVEVGVHRGKFAKIFLDNWLGDLYIGVDPWQVPPGYEEQQKLLEESTGDREQDYEYCRRLLLGHIRRCRAELHRGLSHEIVQLIADNTLDFVYIDADHRYEQARFDLEIWYPKVKPGGILAGHDFLEHGTDAFDQAVQRAVINFAIDKRLPINIVAELQCLPWSFYFEKPL